MAKFYGKVGYAETVEVEPGIWEERIVERDYYGDLTRASRKLQTSGSVNDDVNLANEISIVADPYAVQNFDSMRYIEFIGVKWKVVSAEIQHPRLILTTGGVYNG